MEKTCILYRVTHQLYIVGVFLKLNEVMKCVVCCCSEDSRVQYTIVYKYSAVFPMGSLW